MHLSKLHHNLYFMLHLHHIILNALVKLCLSRTSTIRARIMKTSKWGKLNASIKIRSSPIFHGSLPSQIYVDFSG